MCSQIYLSYVVIYIHIFWYIFNFLLILYNLFIVVIPPYSLMLNSGIRPIKSCCFYSQPLLKFMIPLMFVYMFEYFINQALVRYRKSDHRLHILCTVFQYCTMYAYHMSVGYTVLQGLPHALVRRGGRLIMI